MLTELSPAETVVQNAVECGVARTKSVKFVPHSGQ
jgi:hypothetical protein